MLVAQFEPAGPWAEPSGIIRLRFGDRHECAPRRARGTKHPFAEPACPIWPPKAEAGRFIMSHGKANLPPDPHRRQQPPPVERRSFNDAREAVTALQELCDRNTAYLREAFAGLEAASTPDTASAPTIRK